MRKVKTYQDYVLGDPLPLKDQKILFEKILKHDKKAEEELILRHLPYVKNIATKYLNQGLSLEDLISEGTIGLLRAFKVYLQSGNFDKTFGWFAARYINYRIKVKLKQQNRITKAEDQLQTRDRLYTIEESVERKQTIAKLKEIKSSCLTNREQEVLEVYTDNEHGDKASLARKYQVSIGRLEQLNARALKKVINCYETSTLLTYLDDPKSAKEELEQKRKQYIETSINEKKWYYLYELLKTYQTKYNSILVPRTYKTINGYDYDESGECLGEWLNKQYLAYKNETIDLKKLDLLNLIGFQKFVRVKSKK